MGEGPGLPERQSMTDTTREMIHRKKEIQLNAQLALILEFVPPFATRSDMQPAAACVSATTGGG